MFHYRDGDGLSGLRWAWWKPVAFKAGESQANWKRTTGPGLDYFDFWIFMFFCPKLALSGVDANFLMSQMVFNDIADVAMKYP